MPALVNGGGTFQSDTGGTFHSDIPGTFESDMGGTFKVLQSGDTHQLILYTRWPRFQYCRAGYLNGQERSINPKTITTGAQYLLIPISS